MAPKPFNWWRWTKIAAGGAVFAVGGPWVTQKLMVSEEEALSRFTPEEQKKILQKKREKEQEFEAFVTKLKEQTKSSKSIWALEAEEKKNREKEARQATARRQTDVTDELAARKEAMRQEAGLLGSGR